MLKRLELCYWRNKGSLERSLLICWLLKDFAWMTTIVLQGFIFGSLSILLHGLFLIADNRLALRFYHASMFLWVIANFIWMFLEFTCSNPSTHIHIGLVTPIGGVTDYYQVVLIQIKHWLFLCAVIIQIVLYIGLLKGFVPMPIDEPETGIKGDNPTEVRDIQHENENEMVTIDLSTVNPVIDNNKTVTPTEEPIVEADNNANACTNADERIFGCSMIVIENFYVLFWMFKDLFWSWSTG